MQIIPPNPNSGLGQGVFGVETDTWSGYAQQWNFGVQRELPGGVALEVDYAGSKGTHLPGPNQQIDQLPWEIGGFVAVAATAGIGYALVTCEVCGTEREVRYPYCCEFAAAAAARTLVAR